MIPASGGDDEPFAVYLDMNHWYALGRASAGEPERPSDPEVLERLRMLRRDGRVVVPLSAIHYSELRENPRDRFTAEAGAVMEELSDFWTLAPMSTVFAEEFDAQLKARFGRPAVVRTSPKIGRGVGFAHGMPGSFGLDASPAAAEALRRRLGEDGIRQLEASANKAFEHFALQGGRRVPGFNPYEDRDRAEARLARVLRVVENLCLDPSLYRRLEDVVVAGEFIAEMFEDFLGALVYADSDPYRIATELTDSKEKMTELLLAMPSRRVAVTVRQRYHRDLQHKWTVNDLRDIDALSVAVPYCDVVVTDHAARTAITHAHLDRRFSTIVTSRRQELLQSLPPGAHTSKPSGS